MKMQANNIKSITMPKVKFTKNYKSFHFLPFNRDIMPGHVEKMGSSVLYFNSIIRPVVTCKTDCIDGQMKRYIMDAQHLFTTLSSQGMEIPYIEIPVKDEIDLVNKIARMNSSSKNWHLMDYVTAFKTLIGDYRQLFKWRNQYNIEPLMVARICAGGERGSQSKSIKDGSFRIINSKAEKMCNAFSQIFMAVGSSDRGIKHSFLQVFMDRYETYDHEKTIKSINKNITIVRAMSDSSEAYKYIATTIFK